MPQEAKHPCFPQLQTAPANTWGKLAGEQSHFSVSDSPLHFDCICCSKIIFWGLFSQRKNADFHWIREKTTKDDTVPILTLGEKQATIAALPHICFKSESTLPMETKLEI